MFMPSFQKSLIVEQFQGLGLLETLRLLKFIGIDISFNQIIITLYHRGTQGDNSEIQNAVFSRQKTYCSGT